MQVDENREQKRSKKPAWVKMGRGLAELDLPITSSDLASVGQGAVQGGEEDEAVERPTDLPLAPGAAVVPPPGSASPERDWRSWGNLPIWDSNWSSQGPLFNSGVGRKRTLSESSCISSVSITPRKRRLSETDTACKKEQPKLTTPVRKYQVNPKALQSGRSNARQLGKQTVDTENGLDLGKLLELEYSSSDEILSEGNRNKESRACRSKRHGRGWCKFGDSCVVRREGALSENVAQEEQGQGETTEKKYRTETETETQNKRKKECWLGVKSICNVDQLCRSKFHGRTSSGSARRASGTEVIVGIVGPGLVQGEDVEQVSNISLVSFIILLICRWRSNKSQENKGTI